MLGGYNQNLLRSKFTLIFRSVFIVVSLLALQACISSSGGRSSNSNNAIPLVSGGVTSKLSRVSNGASMSRVRQIFGDPEDRDYISGFEVWQYCSTGMFSDDFVAIVFIDGKVAERKKYVRRIDGFCSSFFKSASDLNFYSVQVALQERSQKNIARQTAEAIERRLAAAKQVQEKAEQAQEKAKSPDIAESFNQTALSVNFARGPQHMNDVAVIIGNANYGKHGSDIPDVKPAYADAESIRKWLIEAKGLREGNIIFLRDATSAQMTGVFGSQSSHKGKLFNWTKKGISNVYVYYAGHGAPAGKEGSAFLVPSDVSSDSIELTGYPLKRLYANLEKLPAKSVTVLLLRRMVCFYPGVDNSGVMLLRCCTRGVRHKQNFRNSDISQNTQGTGQAYCDICRGCRSNCFMGGRQLQQFVYEIFFDRPGWCCGYGATRRQQW